MSEIKCWHFYIVTFSSWLLRRYLFKNTMEIDMNLKDKSTIIIVTLTFTDNFINPEINLVWIVWIHIIVRYFKFSHLFKVWNKLLPTFTLLDLQSKLTASLLNKGYNLKKTSICLWKFLLYSIMKNSFNLCTVTKQEQNIKFGVANLSFNLSVFGNDLN